MLERYTMRWRQITLNESQAQYSNRCCFCEYGNWHLPPFYLICTKKYDTPYTHTHYPYAWNTTHTPKWFPVVQFRSLFKDYQTTYKYYWISILLYHRIVIFETISYIIKDINNLIILPILSIQTFAYHLTVIQSQ